MLPWLHSLFLLPGTGFIAPSANQCWNPYYTAVSASFLLCAGTMSLPVSPMPSRVSDTLAIICKWMMKKCFTRKSQVQFGARVIALNQGGWWNSHIWRELSCKYVSLLWARPSTWKVVVCWMSVFSWMGKNRAWWLQQDGAGGWGSPARQVTGGDG